MDTGAYRQEHIGTQRHTKAHKGTQRHTKAHKGTQRHTKAHKGTHNNVHRYGDILRHPDKHRDTACSTQHDTT
jgi:hypothetical protein